MTDHSQIAITSVDRGKPIPVRYVVLHHTGIVPEHFDLMVHIPGAARLMTWRIGAPPSTWTGQAPVAERLDDHRLAYLSYEGEISGNRGRVKRVAAGEGEIRGSGQRQFRLRLQGDIACEMELPE